jgi:2-hydroxy-3-oxopropionate reductase
MIDRSFAPGAKISLHRKDMDIILQTARELAVSLPLSATVAELMDGVIARHGSELDHSALITMVEDLANFRLAQPLQDEPN